MQVTGVSGASSSLTIPRHFIFVLLTGLIVVALRLPGLAQEAAQVATVQHPLITAPIDETQITTLKGNTHPLAKPIYDVGSAPGTLPMQRMLLVLKRSPEQESALRKLLDDQQDKASPNYHKWLTPEQFGKQFGPSDDDMQKITAWLQSHGFQVGTTKGRTALEFSGTAAQVREAFHTSVHRYVGNGEQHWANASDPMIPTALTPAVAGVKTLHNFLKKPMVHLAEKYIPAKLVSKSRPEFTSSTGLHALTPSDYQTIYNAPRGTTAPTGQGVTIAVVGRSNLFNQAADISDFRSVFGLTGAGSVNVVLNGPDPGDLGGNDELEATLDASWSGALAPGATIDFVASASTNDADGVDLSELYIIENNIGSIMTESFGTCEAAVTASDGQATSALAEQAAAQGITYMVSAGDTGAEGCDNLGETTAVDGISVNVLASTPFTVATGGTMFNEHGQDSTYWSSTNSNTLGSAISYIPEDVWNETCTTTCQQGQPPLAAGGGGASIYFNKPPWQSGVAGTNSDTARDIPDISLTSAGHDPYLVCLEASCVPDAQGNISFSGVLGTSAAAPSFASIMALVDQSQGGPQGLANYVLYPLALQQQTAGTACNASSTSTLITSTCVFNDVTSGNNSVPGETGYPNGQYAAAKGYDLASGLGSVNIANLISAWPNVKFTATTTTLTLTPPSGKTLTTLAHGDTVGVVLSVTPNSGSGTPSGDVALLAGTSPAQSVPPTAGFGGGVFSVTNGAGSGATNQLPGGTYVVTAQYSGDGAFAASPPSTGISVKVSAESSTTTFAASPNCDTGTNPPCGGVYTMDANGIWDVPISGAQAFGTPIQVTAVVSGTSGTGTPTGTVNFTSTSGTIPNGSSAKLNSQGTASVASNPLVVCASTNLSTCGSAVAFDAGSYTISATYGGDLSFAGSSTMTPVSFSISPGFAAVSGLAPITITAPGGKGTTAVGIIASTGFTTAISFTCSNLPSEATCSSASATGKGPTTVVNTTITVTTTAPHTTLLKSNEQRFYYAVLMGGGLPLAGIFVIAGPRRRRWGTLLGLVLLMAFLVAVPGCGGGGGSSNQQHQQDPGTPAGTYTVTVTAMAGSLSQSGTFTLSVQ